MNIKQQAFTLIELMISMVIGIILVGGVLTVYINSRVSFQTSQTISTLTTDSQFASQMIRQDVQLAGSFGLFPGDIQLVSDANTLPNLLNDCAAGWYADMATNIIAFNDNNPYSATCIPAADGYVANTDILVIRFAESVEIPDASVSNQTIYIRSNAQWAQLFSAATPPTLASEATLSDPQDTQNNKLQSVAYYISNFTDTVGDGYPSLHRISLGTGPALSDEVIVPGVADMQIQFGYDSDSDGSVDQYVNADNAVINWADPTVQSRILSVSVSLLLVAEHAENNLNTVKTLAYAGRTITTANDGKFRRLVTTVLPLTNNFN